MAAIESDSSSSSSSPNEDGQMLVRAAIPAIEAYYADNNTYKGVTLEVLQQRYDAGIAGIRVVKANDRTYCIESVDAPFPWFKAGPASEIMPGDCSMHPLEQLPPVQTDADMCIQLEMNGELYYQVGPSGPQTPGRCPNTG